MLVAYFEHLLFLILVLGAALVHGVAEARHDDPIELPLHGDVLALVAIVDEVVDEADEVGRAR